MGHNVRVSSPPGVQALLGAAAPFDRPGAAVVMDRTRAADIGLVMNTVVLAAPERRLSKLEREIRHVVGESVTFTELRPAKIVDRRPKTYLELYKLSASYCPGLSWKVLAAIRQ